MQLGYSDDQRELFDAFEQFFVGESPISVVRAAEPLGFDPSLWAKLNAMEIWGSHVSLQQLCVIGETVGRSIAPVPFAEHAVAARLLQREDVDTGSVIAGLSLRETDVGGDWTLVPNGAIADIVVGIDGGSLVSVESSAPGRSPRNHASAPLADRNVAEGTRTVLGPRTDGDRAVAEWKAITASMLVGVASRALELAIDYATERHQFGVPIGSFQAIQHSLADLPGSIDGARLLVSKAAAALDAEVTGSTADVNLNEIDDPIVLASMAILFAGDVAAMATDRSLHVHGGYGFAEEYDIQLYYRRARGWALVLGDPAAEAVSLADRLWPSDIAGGH
ncbi:MAG: acyl-CoA dehydrogenase family protein [Ilumatobacteraceae bacterium]